MNKLVRDLIPNIIRNKSQEPVGYIADAEEYKNRLIDKLLEEVTEFREAKSIEELADVLEVIDSIYEAFQFKKGEVQKVKENKNAERGGFSNRYILTDIVL